MPEHVDVLIVGAGISGIGVAHYVREQHPHRTLALLEARQDIGGTWDLFRYPGVRSDSDLYTFGYEFKPWTGDSIASGEAIRNYLHEVVRDEALWPLIRLGQRVTSATWDAQRAKWYVEIKHGGDGETSALTTDWLVIAGGYYRYDIAHSPVFAGQQDFEGQIVHPQFWPANLDYAGKKVVVVGSGATAVTIVPELAKQAAHVTMLQRTPTYILPVPKVDKSAQRLQRLLGPRRAHGIVRRRNIARQRLMWKASRRFPRAVRRFIRWTNRVALPQGYPVDEHFNPPYDPWDQRLCIARDGDLFREVATGAVSVVTDSIRTFTPHGITLDSGEHLEADIVVTATGLEVQPFGGAQLRVGGHTVDLSKTLAYKGMMLSGVPNMAYIVGYTNSSWTLKVGLLSKHLNALLTYMDSHGYNVCTPEPNDPCMPQRPFLDFGAGYITRVRDQLPRQGDRWPWLTSMDYRDDRRLLKATRVVDPELHFSRIPQQVAKPQARAAHHVSEHR